MKLADYLTELKISQATFADSLGVPQALIYQWLSGKRPVAAHQCPKIEKLTNGKVRCEDLNDKVDWAYVRKAPKVAA